MSADFTPTLDQYKNPQYFRFWCQKVLPLVYDDSLSYYELLCKVVNYLNDVIADSDTMKGNIGKLLITYNELQKYVNDYFASLDVQEEINNKLDQMAANGELSEILDPVIINTTENWLRDNITPTSPAVDASLSVSGAAADAKAAGIRINNNLRNLAYNLFDVCETLNKNNSNYQGIDYRWNADGSVTITGTSTAISYYNLFINPNQLPAWIIPGEYYQMIYESTNVSYIIYDYSSGTPVLLAETKSSRYIKIPENCTGLIIRLWIPANTTIDETVFPRLYPRGRRVENVTINTGSNGLYFTDANDINENNITFVSISQGVTTIANVPYGPCFLETIKTNEQIALQIAYPYDNKKQVVMIRSKQMGIYSDWAPMSELGYIPSVDTATADETDKTDMRIAIQTALNTYGHCKLGPGAFYISSQIEMPEGSTLEGSGEATQIYLMSGNGKAAILMKRYSTVRDLSVIGSYTDLTESDFGEQTGSRYGIQYYKGSSDTWTPAYCSISNVFIKNFTGSGIYQYGTGANVEQGLFVSNVHIKNCWCGIHIYANSEFCRYSNVQITYCYIACLNNGGNNAFTNCVFHAYAIGMQIIGVRNNSAHGMCSNSSFCHIGNNTGSALKLDDIEHGFVFNSIQFWYNSVDISNCSGIVFNGCEFGRGTTGAGAVINISGGNTIMFGECVFMNDAQYPPAITIDNNTKTKFNNCYGAITGNEITA